MFNINRNNYFEDLKNNEIFTPRVILDQIFNYLGNFFKDRNFETILENSFGKGDILFEIIKKFPNKNIFGYEIKKEYFEFVKKQLDKTNIKLFNKSFLNSDLNHKYDLIISNPPFAIKERRGLWRDFLHLSFKLLSNKGVMIFILPSYWKQNTNSTFINYVEYYPQLNFLPIFKGTFFKNSLSCDIVIIDKNNKNNYWKNLYNNTLNLK